MDVNKGRIDTNLDCDYLSNCGAAKKSSDKVGVVKKEELDKPTVEE